MDHVSNMKTVLLSILTLASPFRRVTGSGAVDEPPYLPSISSISFSGNGCPQDGSSGRVVNATGSWSELDLTFHNFTATIPGQGSSSRTSNCEAHISASDAAPGWQVSPGRVSVRGLAVLDPGTSLTLFVTAYWSQNASETITKEKKYKNAGADRITALVTDFEELTLWSPCSDSAGYQGILNVNFRAALTSGTGYNTTLPSAYFGPVKVNGTETDPVVEMIKFDWRAC
ncbi:hypothetical protein NKR23_g1798 [Pleurostoma richardsiae]|uniref:Secreted protein n=1 Tax=Pleurostoma richardsiae TaxID=41990 RepID=A0AA38RNE4_9PEZI|nr:hypothetical protein NKR23_g1798 [Pleurostoma richardsiae]